MIKSGKYTLELLESMIIRISIPENTQIELSDVTEMRNGCLQIAQGIKFCILLDATKNFSISSAAREKISGKEYTNERIASAFVTRSIANKMIGNFFIKFNKPADPTKLFSEEASALLWLKKEIQKAGL